jgi:tRNA (guanine-N7-)-methyltransferase
LEIGFGGGEHLLTQAVANPEIGFVGCEPFVNGMAKLLAGIDAASLTNVRLRSSDAESLLKRCLDRSFSVVYIHYPDPWPKRRQTKRRLISDEMVNELARVSTLGGIVRFATDIDDYAGWTLRRFADSGKFIWHADSAHDWRVPWPDWVPTRYETKANIEGRTSVYLTFKCSTAS